jgi:hypothetical protein
MKMTCSVLRGAAGLVFIGVALATLATVGYVVTRCTPPRRARTTWDDVSDKGDWAL